MANAVATPTIPDNRWPWTAGNKYFVLGTISITPSPATYVSGGIAFNLIVPLMKATRAPWFVDINGRTGYQYVYFFGADATSGTLRIFSQDGTPGNPLAELGNGAAIPAAISSDYITFMAIFQGME